MSGNFNVLQTLVNGNIDLTNLSAAAIQALQASTAPLSSHATIAASESRTNTAYGTLTTPDQVAGLIVPANGLVVVRYQATWQESISGAARAAIFIGSNQLVVPLSANASNNTEAAATGGGSANIPTNLVSTPIGLISGKTDGYAGPATTGQALGLVTLGSGSVVSFEIAGSVSSTANPQVGFFGGPCEIFGLPAATYTISVQFKASSGSVTVSNRKLWVEVRPMG